MFLFLYSFGQKNSEAGFIDFNYYYDIEAHTVLTVNILGKLPHGFHYFSLTNYPSPFNDDTLLNDADIFYTEQNLRWKIPKTPLDLTAQWNLRNGNKNDRLRVGTRWLAASTPGLEKLFKALGGFYSLNFHLYQFDHEDNYVFHLEHVYRIQAIWE